MSSVVVPGRLSIYVVSSSNHVNRVSLEVVPGRLSIYVVSSSNRVNRVSLEVFDIENWAVSKMYRRFDRGTAEIDTSLTVMSKHVKFDTVDTIDALCQSMPNEVKAVSKCQKSF